MDNLIETFKSEIIADFCFITNSHQTPFLDHAVDAIMADPALFLSTHYKAAPTGYTSFEMSDPFLTYINILCIIYLTNIILKNTVNRLADLKALHIFLKMKPKTQKEAKEIITTAYKELRGVENTESEKNLIQLVEKVLNYKIGLLK